MLTRTNKNGTIHYSYYDNNQLQQTTYPNGDTVGGIQIGCAAPKAELGNTLLETFSKCK